eukprot:m.118956 g.118956  ORF g.118956 m.118956 type:complete len:610 (-) comp28713_c0_seq1:105-1934(-)
MIWVSLRMMITIFIVAVASTITATSVRGKEVDGVQNVLWFDLDAAVTASNLTYNEQLLAYVFQGLVNDASLSAPVLQLNAAYINFDWPESDLFWRRIMTEQRRVAYTNISGTTLCSLVTGGDKHNRIRGTVAYDPTLSGGDAREWALPIAVTLGAQQLLLPVTTDMLQQHACLQALPLVKDLRDAPWASNSTQAWEWAFKTLQPGASKTVAYNLYHYAPQIQSDPQSNATLANIDFAVQQKAFISNFKTGNHVQVVNPQYAQAMAYMEPLYSAYGWTDDEFSYVWMTTQTGAGADGTPDNAASGGGGAVFCSFATPNLSFWKLLALPDGRITARKLPVFDRGMKYDKQSTYVLLETNEGDTPRIVVSAFSKSWTDARRGSIPVSWSIDPVLGEQFPALFDYFAETAGANDSFISGPGGCGYVYYGRMSDSQVKSFAARCGRFMHDYGPAVVDTYGQTGNQSNTFAVLTNFSRYASTADGKGVAPDMYIAQPTKRIGYANYICAQTEDDQWLPDGTPFVCTNPDLFYIPGALGHQNCSACELSKRITDVADAGTQFITVYGGLAWTASSVNPQNDFWNLWSATVEKLGSNITVVGAQEMARLAREAKSRL